MSTQIDHLVVAAHSLAQGVAWCESTLGITPGPGGVHARMGTHNRLFRMDSQAFPSAYFEIIAIDPDAPPPGRPRWFGLDNPALQARLAEQGPQLLHAVARTPQLDMLRWGLVNLGEQAGEPLAFERQSPAGRLAWRMLVREDGQLLHRGALPSLIEWQGPLHPAQAMPDSGVVLQSLALRGLPPRTWQLLQLRGVEGEASGEAAGEPSHTPALQASLRTPRGVVSLVGGC